MRNDRLAFGFVNGLGNFIFLTAAVKVLRNWGYDDITLITDLNNPHNKRNYALLQEIYPYAFNRLETSFEEEKYDRLFICAWSRPSLAVPYMEKYNRKVPIVRWNIIGFHEVEMYLRMVGASWKEFDGYMFDVAEGPILQSDYPRIALAQCSGSGQSDKKAWPYFPELSSKLRKMGYSVVLVGYNDELSGCEYDEDFRNRTTISEAGKVLSQCDLLVAPSTGLTVVADAVKTPVLLLEGPMFTARAHPLQTDYRIVRSYISCAPCFQTPVWDSCREPLCMNRITVDQVIKGVLSFKTFKQKKIFKGSDFESVVVKKVNNKRVAYLFCCKDRYRLLDEMLTSFKKSNPYKGTMFILNDGSIDPRVEERILNFKMDGINVIYKKLEYQHMNVKGVRTAMLYNMLSDMVIDSGETFDYVTLIDSDLLFKPGWIQKIAGIYDELKVSKKIGLITGFSFRTKDDSTTYGCDNGKYRLNSHISGQWLMSYQFFMSEFGRFEDGAGSADISKCDDLHKRGFTQIKVSPSVIQHAGAYSSSLRIIPGALVEDFR
jgi:hypothetical protein